MIFINRITFRCLVHRLIRMAIVDREIRLHALNVYPHRRFIALEMGELQSFASIYLCDAFTFLGLVSDKQ